MAPPPTPAPIPDFNALSIEDLKEACDDVPLPLHGTKADLVCRLMDYYRKKAEEKLAVLLRVPSAQLKAIKGDAGESELYQEIMNMYGMIASTTRQAAEAKASEHEGEAESLIAAPHDRENEEGARPTDRSEGPMTHEGGKSTFEHYQDFVNGWNGIIIGMEGGGWDQAPPYDPNEDYPGSARVEARIQEMLADAEARRVEAAARERAAEDEAEASLYRNEKPLPNRLGRTIFRILQLENGMTDKKYELFDEIDEAYAKKRVEIRKAENEERAKKAAEESLAREVEEELEAAVDPGVDAHAELPRSELTTPAKKLKLVNRRKSSLFVKEEVLKSDRENKEDFTPLSAEENDDEEEDEEYTPSKPKAKSTRGRAVPKKKTPAKKGRGGRRKKMNW